MKSVAALLLVGVFARHHTSQWFASGSYSPAAVFYMIGGLWEAILCAVLASIIWASEKTKWRTLALWALAIGAIEGAQVFACRLALDDIRSVPRGASICDHVTGLPVGATIMSLYVLAICFTLFGHRRAGRA